MMFWNPVAYWLLMSHHWLAAEERAELRAKRNRRIATEDANKAIERAKERART